MVFIFNLRNIDSLANVVILFAIKTWQPCHYIKPIARAYTRECHENKNTRFWATYGNTSELYIVIKTSCVTKSLDLLNIPIRAEIVLHCLLLCSCHFSCLSIMIPKDSVLLTRVICSPAIDMFVVVASIEFNFCREPIIMYSDLLLFKVSLFAVNHAWTFSKSWFNLPSIPADDTPLQDRLVSFANIEAFVISRQFGRSFI